MHFLRAYSTVDDTSEHNVGSPFIARSGLDLVGSEW